MTEHQNIEEVDELLWVVDEGPLKGRRFVHTFAPCPDPICPCRNFMLEVAEEQEEGSRAVRLEGILTLDLEERTLLDVTTDDEDLEDAAERWVEGLEAPVWTWLDEKWTSLKEAQLREARLEDLRPVFPKAVLEGTALAPYAMGVPWSPGLPFQHLGKAWALADEYCVDPACPCSDATLVFVPFEHMAPDSGHLDLEVEDLPVATWDYEADTFEAQEAADGTLPRMADLAASLRASRPDLGAELRERHERMRTLCRVARTRKPLTPFRTAARSKVGRNEPCPCGSGRKSKRCCWK